MVTYQKYTGSIIPVFDANAHTEEEVTWYAGSSVKESIYFGLEDNNFNYVGNLTNNSYILTSSSTDCKAAVKAIDNTKTAGKIYITIPENNTSEQRRIIFSYNNIDILTIIQGYKSSTKGNIIFRINSFSGSERNGNIVIGWNSTNWGSEGGQKIKCYLDDITPNSDGSFNTTQELYIGTGYANYTVKNVELYSGHAYKLSGPCEPATYNGYNFSVDTTTKRYNNSTIIY